MGARKERTARPLTRKDSRSSSLRPAEAQAETTSFRDQLGRLYLGQSRVAHHFRYGLLIFDAVTIMFIIGTSGVQRWAELLETTGVSARA